MSRFLQLLESWAQLAGEEREVLVTIASRLLAGQRQYGKLDIERDGRDFIKETGEELFDSCVYMAVDSVKLRRARDGLRRAGGVTTLADETKT